VRIEQFFKVRKGLKRPKRETKLDDDMAISLDEARTLCFEVAEKIGFDSISCDKLITIVGNPFSTLKYLVAAAGEGRKLADLQKSRATAVA